jgi:predicted DNA-binding ribbon-helix-helix protein
MGKRVNLVVDAEVWRNLKVIAAERDMSLQDLAYNVLRTFVAATKEVKSKGEK